MGKRGRWGRRCAEFGVVFVCVGVGREGKGRTGERGVACEEGAQGGEMEETCLWNCCRYGTWLGRIYTTKMTIRNICTTSECVYSGKEGERQRQISCRERRAGGKRNSRYLSVHPSPTHPSASHQNNSRMQNGMYEPILLPPSPQSSAPTGNRIGVRPLSLPRSLPPDPTEPTESTPAMA
jgi:hypothetical protein